MRTTLTLDPDVAALLKAAVKKRRAPLKVVVNQALRRGLLAGEEPGKRPVRFRMSLAHAGKPLVPDFDNVAEILAIAEGEAYR